MAFAYHIDTQVCVVANCAKPHLVMEQNHLVPRWAVGVIPPQADWAALCKGDGSKFCCMRNGCHFVCNCTI